MRNTVLSLMSVATLILAGCNGSPSAQPAGADGAPASAKTVASGDNASAPNEVSGTISLRAGSPVPSATATLVLNLVDVSATAVGSAPLASKTSPAGAFPQPFKLTFNPAEAKADGMYVVQAIMTDGDRRYTMPIQVPVLGKGGKNDGVGIELVATQTPGEKVMDAFAAEEKLLGGMKMTHGTKLEANVSRGWQLFRQAGQVEFIRELVDYGDKGFTSTDYAYKDGKAWAVVQETRPTRDGKATAIDRAGWSEDGALVLKERQVGSDVTALDDDAVAKLRKQAKEILAVATGGKNK